MIHKISKNSSKYLISIMLFTFLIIKNNTFTVFAEDTTDTDPTTYTINCSETRYEKDVYGKEATTIDTVKFTSDKDFRICAYQWINGENVYTEYLGTYKKGVSRTINKCGYDITIFDYSNSTMTHDYTVVSTNTDKTSFVNTLSPINLNICWGILGGNTTKITNEVSGIPCFNNQTQAYKYLNDFYEDGSANVLDYESDIKNPTDFYTVSTDWIEMPDKLCGEMREDGTGWVPGYDTELFLCWQQSDSFFKLYKAESMHFEVWYQQGMDRSTKYKKLFDCVYNPSLNGLKLVYLTGEGYNAYIDFSDCEYRGTLSVRNKYVDKDTKTIYYSKTISLLLDDMGEFGAAVIEVGADINNLQSEGLVHATLDDLNTNNDKNITDYPTASDNSMSLSSLISFVKNGFGVLGDNGIIAFLNNTFSGIPDMFWSLITLSVSITVVLLVIKIVRG